MILVPPALSQKGALLLLEPQTLRADGHDAATALVGLTAAGDLVVHTAGGIFSSARTDVIPRSSLVVTLSADEVGVSGGNVRSLAIRAHAESLARAKFTAISAGQEPGADLPPAWTTGVLTEAFELTLDPNDPRAAPRARALGGARATAIALTGPDALRIDATSEVVDLPLSSLRAVEAVPGDPNGVVVHAPRLLADGRVRVGFKLRSLPTPPLAVSKKAPLGLVLAQAQGHLEGRPTVGRLLLRLDDALELLDERGLTVGSIATPTEARWRAEDDVLLVRGVGESMVANVRADHAAWLMRGVPENAAPLFLIERGPAPAGAGEVRVDGGKLVITTSSEGTLDLATLDPSELRATPTSSSAVRIEVGGTALTGPPKTTGPLREAIAGVIGRAVLAESDIADLYRRWHTLRTERWLWLVYGPIFVTAHQLEQAGRLPREPGEDDETLARRRLVAETFIVADQARALRVRLGTSAVALPYALLEEEARFLKAFAPTQVDAALARVRPGLIAGLRGQIRQAQSNLSVAQVDLERAVGRLEPVHFPELRGQPPGMFNASMLGRVGLGAAVMLLNPISGTIQIASALAGTVTDRLSKDGTSRVLVDRFGPMCRSSWDLLVDVAAVSAAEARVWFDGVWADLAHRDRALHEALPEAERGRLKEAVTADIGRLQAWRHKPVPIEGLTIADIVASMMAAIDEGPKPLLAQLVDTE